MTAPPSEGLRRKATARFASDGIGFIAGAFAAVITSRVLGPSGQGVFAVLGLIAAIAASLGTFGLVDAAVVQHRRHGLSFEYIAGATLGALATFASIAALLAAAVEVAIIAPHSADTWIAIAVSSISAPVTGIYLGVGALFLMNERIERASVLSVLTPLLTLAGLVGWVVLAGFGVAGAVLAGTGAAAISALVGAVWLRSDRQLVRPRFSPGYIKRVWRYGIKVQAVSFVTLATAKLDVLLVFWMQTASDAGRYSIALTAATVPSVVAFSLAAAMFPRFASVTDEEADELLRRACRVSVAGSLVIAAALAVLLPELIPAVFGIRFRGAIAPAEVLLIGGLATGVQWTTARARAARGDANLLLAAFSFSLAAMVLLDLVLIPTLGTVGAAMGSSIGSCAGAALCVRRGRIGALGVVPRAQDFAALTRTLLHAVKSIAAVARLPLRKAGDA